MPFLLAEILNFQGSTHHIGVGSFSYSIIPVCGVLIIFYSIYNLIVELNKKEGGE